ncbi:MAG: hypothetical protein QOG10_6893 [Kribbellaceae bacterium]|nr:hypothetical protein [Kribbellaceae bacterium]
MAHYARDLVATACVLTALAGCGGGKSATEAKPTGASSTATTTASPSAVTSTVSPSLPKDDGPVLIDDRGKAVPNPMLIKHVYDLLKKGDVKALLEYGETSKSLWDYEGIPAMLEQSDVRTRIMRSMTVHPHCEEGCTYPGFVNTGWDTDVARADGRALGVTPENVPHPEDVTPVYTSDFAGCDCSWLGPTAPGK